MQMDKNEAHSLNGLSCALWMPMNQGWAKAQPSENDGWYYQQCL